MQWEYFESSTHTNFSFSSLDFPKVIWLYQGKWYGGRMNFKPEESFDYTPLDPLTLVHNIISCDLVSLALDYKEESQEVLLEPRYSSSGMASRRRMVVHGTTSFKSKGRDSLWSFCGWNEMMALLTAVSVLWFSAWQCMAYTERWSR